MRKYFLIFIFLFSSLASAEERSYWEDVGDNITIPFSSPVRKTTYILLGVTAFSLAIEKEISRPFEDHMNENKPLGSYSKYGDLAGQLIPNAVYMAGMYIDYLITDSKLSKERAHLMLQSTFYSGLTTTVLKYTVREPRPNKNGGNESFPSGHATTAFAFASVVGAEHEWYYGLAAYSLATFTALSRINDHRHYVQDVVAGASIGISYGLGLYYKMHGEAEASKGEEKNVSWMQVLPTDNLDGAVFSFAYSWR